jgi:predicted Zn-dependent protease
VFDSRINIISDPQDPDGGFAPFLEAGSRHGYAGYPTPRMGFVEGGILKDLSYSIGYGMVNGKVPSELPWSLRLSGGQSTIPDMIKNCQEGVYVNRFSDVRLVDPLTGMMTGVTRDGCFLVKNGKISKPVKNFRFTDSPFFAFNSLEMIGVPVRTAFGYTGDGRWPQQPMIVPPMMVRDFNFSALIDAV